MTKLKILLFNPTMQDFKNFYPKELCDTSNFISNKKYIYSATILNHQPLGTGYCDVLSEVKV